MPHGNANACKPCHLQRPVRNEVFAHAAGINDGLNQILGHVLAVCHISNKTFSRGKKIIATAYLS